MLASGTLCGCFAQLAVAARRRELAGACAIAAGAREPASRGFEPAHHKYWERRAPRRPVALRTAACLKAE
jgi:hypothetical protein